MNRHPFSPPNGADPFHFVKRPDVADRTHEFVSAFARGQFPLGVALGAGRGMGKTVELGRLSNRLTDEGVFSIFVTLRGGDLELDLNDGLSRALDRRDKMAREFDELIWAGNPTQQIRGRDAEDVFHGARFLDRLHRLHDAEGERSAKSLALLVDEGDFMTADAYEQSILDILARAAQEDLPIGMVIAGVGVEFWQALQGRRSFAPDLFEPVWLRRLTEQETRESLVMTAASAGQTWNPTELDAIVEMVDGVPRRLHVAGAQTFSAVAEGATLVEAAHIATSRLKAMINASVAVHVSTAATRYVVECVTARNPTDLWTIAEGAEAHGLGGEAVTAAARTLVGAGVLEIDFWGNVYSMTPK